MKPKYWLLGAGILLAAATPAQAEYLICVVRADNSKLFVESEAIDIGDRDEIRERDKICPAFVQYVIHDLGKTDAQFMGISSADSREDQLHDLDVWRRLNSNSPDVARIVTGWRPDAPRPRPPTIPTPLPRKSALTPGLTVKTDTSLIDARKKYEEAVLQSQRDDAAARAKQIADTARNRAEMQLKLNKFFEELRKRGSAQ